MRVVRCRHELLGRAHERQTCVDTVPGWSGLQQRLGHQPRKTPVCVGAVLAGIVVAEGVRRLRRRVVRDAAPLLPRRVAAHRRDALAAAAAPRSAPGRRDVAGPAILPAPPLHAAPMPKGTGSRCLQSIGGKLQLGVWVSGIEQAPLAEASPLLTDQHYITVFAHRPVITIEVGEPRVSAGARRAPRRPGPAVLSAGPRTPRRGLPRTPASRVCATRRVHSHAW